MIRLGHFARLLGIVQFPQNFRRMPALAHGHQQLQPRHVGLAGHGQITRLRAGQHCTGPGQLGRQRSRRMRLGKVGDHLQGHLFTCAATLIIKQPKIILAGRMPHAGGLTVEHKGARQIGRHAEAVFMQLGEVIKGIGLLVFNGLFQPVSRARRIRLYAVALLIHHAQRVQRGAITLPGGQ